MLLMFRGIEFDKVNATDNRMSGQRDLVKIVSYQQLLIGNLRYIKAHIV